MIYSVVCLYKAPEGSEHGEAEFWRLDRWGGEYVKRLIRGLGRVLEDGPWPWSVTVMTDRPSVWSPCCGPESRWPVSLVPMPGEVCESTGWWAKVGMFGEQVSSGPTLYLDLDNVIGGDLSPIFSLPLSEKQPMWMLDDRCLKGVANASTMWFDADHPAVRGLWWEYRDHARVIEREFSGDWPGQSDQAYYPDRLKRAGCEVGLMQDVLPEGFVLNSRCELERGADWSRTSLVYGSWHPKPHESSHPYFAKHWR